MRVCPSHPGLGKKRDKLKDKLGAMVGGSDNSGPGPSMGDRVDRLMGSVTGGVQVGVDIPVPLVDLAAATREAKARVHALRAQPEVQLMQSQIAAFLQQWLPNFIADHRSYLTVAIGCTGGQHRSVYLVEQLSQAFASQWLTLKRHRELDSLR